MQDQASQPSQPTPQSPSTDLKKTSNQPVGLVTPKLRISKYLLLFLGLVVFVSLGGAIYYFNFINSDTSLFPAERGLGTRVTGDKVSEDSARRTGKIQYFDREVNFCGGKDGYLAEDTDREGRPNGVLSLVTHVHDTNPSTQTVGVYVAPGGPVVYYPVSEIRIMDHPVEQTPVNYFPGTLDDLEGNDCVLVKRTDNLPGEVTPEDDVIVWGFR